MVLSVKFLHLSHHFSNIIKIDLHNASSINKLTKDEVVGINCYFFKRLIKNPIAFGWI